MRKMIRRGHGCRGLLGQLRREAVQLQRLVCCREVFGDRDEVEVAVSLDERVGKHGQIAVVGVEFEEGEGSVCDFLPK